MERNDKFNRQSGEDAGAHFARLARDLWGCVDELKRQVDRSDHERARDREVTGLWRTDIGKRLERVEDHIDKLRFSANGGRQKTSLFEVDLKTLVLVATAVGAVIYEILRRSTVQ